MFAYPVQLCMTLSARSSPLLQSSLCSCTGLYSSSVNVEVFHASFASHWGKMGVICWWSLMLVNHDYTTQISVETQPQKYTLHYIPLKLQNLYFWRFPVFIFLVMWTSWNIIFNHFANITRMLFECSLNILKHVITFKNVRLFTNMHYFS